MSKKNTTTPAGVPVLQEDSSSMLPEGYSVYDGIKLENQLCFPLYAVSKEITRRYKPFLDPLDLTYTQYLVMMVLWEERKITAHELGKKLHLDSGTLTPVLKKLESKGYLTRERGNKDERTLILTLTDEGLALREEAVKVPLQMGGCFHIEPEEAKMIYDLLYRMLAELAPEE